MKNRSCPPEPRESPGPAGAGVRSWPADPDDEQVVLGGAQLILAEKRTAQAVMRTGIGVFALPLGVLSLLVASSRYYNAGEVLHLFLPLLGLCAALVVLGSYLVVRSIQRIHHYDRLPNVLKSGHFTIGRYLDDLGGRGRPERLDRNGRRPYALSPCASERRSVSSCLRS